jgi:O-antigen/teichoic acid export membrane protein
MLAGRLTVAVLGWIGTVLIARDLSEAQWGAYSFVFSVVGIVGLLADLQISRVVMVEIIDQEGDDRLENTVGVYVALRLALALASYVIAVGVVVLGGDSNEILVATLVAGLSFFFASTLWSLVTVCQIRMWMRPVAIGLALGQFVQLVLTVVLYVNDRGTLVRYAIPAVLYDLVAMVFVIVAVRPIVRVRPSIDLARWWKWIKAAVPLALGTSLATLYFRVDTVMLRQLDGLTAVGRYQYGYKFSDILAFVASSLLGVVLPLLVRAWPGRVSAFHVTFRQAFLLLVMAGAAASVAFAVVAEPALRQLYDLSPAVAADAAVPARILVLGQAINFFSQLAAMVLIATNRHRVYPWAALVGLATNVALNFLFIPWWSAAGAGIATVVTELIVIAVMGAVVVGIPGVRPFPWKSVAIVVVASALLWATTAALLEVVWWPLTLLAGSAVYLLALHLLRVDGPGGLRKVWRDSRFDTTTPRTTTASPSA